MRTQASMIIVAWWKKETKEYNKIQNTVEIHTQYILQSWYAYINDIQHKILTQLKNKYSHQ